MKALSGEIVQRILDRRPWPPSRSRPNSAAHNPAASVAALWPYAHQPTLDTRHSTLGRYGRKTRSQPGQIPENATLPIRPELRCQFGSLQVFQRNRMLTPIPFASTTPIHPHAGVIGHGYVRLHERAPVAASEQVLD